MISHMTRKIMTPHFHRRFFLKAGIAAAASFTLETPWTRAKDDPAPQRRIFVAGGGMFPGDPDRRMLRYVLSLTDKTDPIVYCLATAKGDHPETLVTWYEIMNTLPCRPRHLRMFGPTRNLRDFESQLLSADAIFIPGGNTLNMLAIWKAQGVDAILRTAWERGILLAGESAGMSCWFEQVLTDSRPDRLTKIEGLGWFKGSVCPHYHSEPQRKPTFHKMILDGELKDGLACDDDAGILFEGDKMVRVVALTAKATAYTVRRSGGQVMEEPLKAEMLEKTQ
jgi:dipeptidase E